MYVSVQQLRLTFAAIGVLAALVLALDLARMTNQTPSAPAPTPYRGIPRHTPGSTAHLRLAYRSQLAVRASSS